MQVDMSRENTGIGRHAWGSVAALLIRTRFGKVHDRLLGEVCHIVHALSSALSLSGLKSDRGGLHNVALMSLHLTASGVHIDVVLDLFDIGGLGLVDLVGEEVVHLVVHNYKL